MLFDEIHNKRVLQIMPLNTSLFLFFSLFALLEKSFVIIIIVENTTRSVQYTKTWVFCLRECITWEIKLMVIVSSSLVSSWLYLSLIYPSLALPHYPSPLDERLVPVSRVDYQNIILYARRHCYCCRHLVVIIFAVVDKDGKRIFSPRAKKNRNDFKSPNHIFN